MVRRPAGRELPFGLVAVVDQDRPASGAAAGLDVVEDVADHPGLRKVHAPRPGRPLDHPGPRLATTAVNGIALDGPLRVMRAIREAGQGHPEPRQEFAESP